MTQIKEEKIVILDFGSQYTQLIARRLRDLNVYSEILPFDTPSEVIKAEHPKGIILSGGPESVVSEVTLSCDPQIFELGIPMLGICYGLQLLAVHFGGEVSQGKQHEFGHNELVLKQPSLLLKDYEKPGSDNTVWMSHEDKITKMPLQFKTLASSEASPHCVIAHEKKPIYGLQFHPEVTHTHQGQLILQRFVKDICGCQAQWEDTQIIEDMLAHVRNTVQNEKVLLALSGGVDSTVLAALLKEAVGEQLVCVFIDTGLLRKNEASEVIESYQHLGLNLKVISAASIFYDRLKGIMDPEQKRKVIGNLFIELFEEEAKGQTDIQFLAQGTVYSDVIESGASSKSTKVIKSHHNVGGLPERLNLKLLEPFRFLFKDEVKSIGKALGLSPLFLKRHPFPGVGLGVRILGEVTEEKVKILQQADDIFIKALKAHQLYDKVSQAFAVFLPVKSVGVVGDHRRYADVVALRAVKTEDFMTAKAHRFDAEFLEKVGREIVNKIPQISRVVYDITSKPPSTVEWE